MIFNKFNKNKSKKKYNITSVIIGLHKIYEIIRLLGNIITLIETFF